MKNSIRYLNNDRKHQKNKDKQLNKFFQELANLRSDHPTQFDSLGRVPQLLEEYEHQRFWDL